MVIILGVTRRYYLSPKKINTPSRPSVRTLYRYINVIFRSSYSTTYCTYGDFFFGLSPTIYFDIPEHINTKIYTVTTRRTAADLGARRQSNPGT